MENDELDIAKKNRRKAGVKRRNEENNSHDRSMETMNDDPTEAPGAASTSTVQADDVLREDGEPPRKHAKIMPVRNRQQQHPQQRLPHRRPNKKYYFKRAKSAPKAPQNSTQFIIDDHENPAFSIDDFERSFITAPGNREDVGWSPYFQQEFENVYQTAREAEPVDWSHVILEEISSSEERVKSLEQQLAKYDPNVFLPQMDQNREVPFHNSSSESSSEDPSSSSSQSEDEDEDEDEEGVQNGTDTDSSDGPDTTDGEEATDEQTAANSVNWRVSYIPDSQISATIQGGEEAAPSRMENEEDGANAEEVNSSRRGSERTESVQSVEDVVNTH